MEYKFTSDNFQQEVLESKEPVMIDFYADWCGPCQMMGPVVANFAEEYAGKVKSARSTPMLNRSWRRITRS